LSKNILNGTLNINKQDVVNSYREVEFNSLSDRINRNIEILKNAANTELKRYKMNPNLDRESILQHTKYILSYAKEDADTVSGIMSYAGNTLAVLKSGISIDSSLCSEFSSSLLSSTVKDDSVIASDSAGVSTEPSFSVSVQEAKQLTINAISKIKLVIFFINFPPYIMLPSILYSF
jgi:hypothetical protein